MNRLAVQMSVAAVFLVIVVSQPTEKPNNKATVDSPMKLEVSAKELPQYAISPHCKNGQCQYEGQICIRVTWKAHNDTGICFENQGKTYKGRERSSDGTMEPVYEHDLSVFLPWCPRNQKPLDEGERKLIEKRNCPECCESALQGSRAEIVETAYHHYCACRFSKAATKPKITPNKSRD